MVRVTSETTRSVRVADQVTGLAPVRGVLGAGGGRSVHPASASTVRILESERATVGWSAEWTVGAGSGRRPVIAP